MFDARDPRSSLAVAARPGPAGVAAAADYIEFTNGHMAPGTPAENFVVAYTEPPAHHRPPAAE
jgi:hypothetical protein